MEEEYRFDEFDDGEARKEISEVQVEKLQKFVREFETQLRGIENALEESLSEVWDSQTDPISLVYQQSEQTTLFDLICTDNKVFNKIMQVFCGISVEIEKLKKEAEDVFLPQLATFGEDGKLEVADMSKESMECEGDMQLHMAESFPFFLDLNAFVVRCYDVVRNLIRQMASLYHPKQKLYQQSFKGVNLTTVVGKLADLFGVLVCIDEVVVQNDILNDTWAAYKRMMKVVKVEPSRYDCSDESLRRFEKFVLIMESQLLYGRVFHNCIEQEFDFEGLVEVSGNRVLQDQIHSIIKLLLQTISNMVATPAETTERQQYVGICGLYAFYHHTWRDNTDKKTFRALWDMHKRLPVVHLFGPAHWVPTEWLAKRAPTLAKAAGVSDTPSARRQLVTQLDGTFSREITAFYLQVCTWMVRMESGLSAKLDPRDILSTRMSLFTQGAILGYQINNLIRTFLALHLNTQAPMKASHLQKIRLGLETLKAVEYTYHRRSAVIAENITHMVQHTQAGLQAVFAPMAKRLVASRKYSDARLDVLSAVSLVMVMLDGTLTKERRTILLVAIDVLQQMNLLKSYEWEDLKNVQLRKLDLLCELPAVLARGCGCEHMFWNREMIPGFFQDVFASRGEGHKLQYLMAALRDASRVMHTTSSAGVQLRETFKNQVLGALEHNIVEPLCREIETDLRLHIHSHLDVSDRNPFQSGLELRDMTQLLKMNPIRFMGTTLDVHQTVMHHLDTIFYNLTTVAPHDWKTYEEMRNLALEKYNLQLTDVHLPEATLEQGLDVLEIMRNIHIFVARYNYNLNTQTFVEKASDGKYLNAIGIRHVANSIRTHGTGIMNTTVNFTYGFLRQKFAIFSQFLFDDHIKSRLMKDTRWFRDNKAQLDNMYPFDRAVRFNKEIRKLGQNADGLSFLDQFRILITHIGNALGYVRMVRAGGLQYVANAIRFVPDLDHIPSFEDAVKEATLGPDLETAARNADDVLESLSKNFAEGTEYLKLLVNVFAKASRNPANTHLAHFYVIVPPLTLNFVESLLVEKEKLTKKGREGSFTDDGFAIGVAYLLKLLEQNEQFDTLHWFGSVKARYESEAGKYAASLGGLARNKDTEAQTVQLTLSKLKSYEREFELLRYSFTGARIFFKDS